MGETIVVAFGLQPYVLLIAAICAAIGAFIVSRYTIALGWLTYPINFCVLFAGAFIANHAMKYMQPPLDHSYQRALIVSLAGMAVASLVMLVFLSRSRFEN